MEEQLICRNLSLGYEGKTISHSIDFTVKSGEYLCIIGENGAGKSTLLKALLRLQKPINGAVLYGKKINPKDIGYLPQQTIVQKDFPASVHEIVISGCLNRSTFRPFYTKEEQKMAETAMKTLDITNLSKKCYRNLSGGQQQRVLLARALCSTKKMLLLDEPSSGLDPMVSHEMYELISKLNKEKNITIIMVTHDIPMAIKYSSTIIHLGQTPLFYGPTSEYANSTVGSKYISLYSIEGGIK